MINVAYASNQGSGIGAFFPLLIIVLIFGPVFMSIAKRKGRNRLVWFLAGCFPLLNVIFGIYLASLPDIDIKKQVSDLIDELQKFEFIPKDQKETTYAQENWTYTCGKMNNMNIPNCPVCGLKRDFLLKKKI